MVRLPRSGRNERDANAQRQPEGKRGRSSTTGSLGRKLVLALGIGALVYLFVRRRDRDDSALKQRVTDTLESGESGDDGLEGAQTIEIGEPPSETDRADGTDSAVDADSVSRTERSDAEIDERVEPDVQEEPAEPGEMSIDEGVASQLTGDESDESNEREAADESGTKPDQAAETDRTSETEQEAETDGASDAEQEAETDDAIDTDNDEPVETDG